MDIGRNIKRQNLELNVDALAAGIRSYADVVEGKPEASGDKKGT